jgi:hypothetical protein
MTAVSQPPGLAERIDRLEKENRNLVTRLEKLEKRGGAIVFEVLRTAVLLVGIVLLLHMMGLVPLNLERVPLVARTVEAETLKVQRVEANDVVVEDRSGTPRARLSLRDSEPTLTFLDGQGQARREFSANSKP